MPDMFIERLKQRMSSRFLQHIGWLGVAEMLTRISRLLTAIVLARCLTAHEYGVVAIALTINELIRVFTSSGLGPRIVQTAADELHAVCNTVYRLNWILNLSLFILQCLLAFPVAWFYGDTQLAWMIIALSMAYLIYPLGLVQVYLVQRDQRLKITALVMGGIVSFDNILTAILALAGFGVWAVVLPKIIAAPLWVAIYHHVHPWAPTRGAGFQGWRKILGFSRNVLGVEILRTLRMNLDNLLIGRLLGLEVLGIYYFARNAGIGISLSIINAYSTAVYPHLASARDDMTRLREKYREAITTVAVMVPVIILSQSLLAPIYVPLVFGQSWVDAGALPVLILLCLSAIPRAFGETTSQLLRAIDKPAVDLNFNLVFTALFVVAILVGMNWGLVGIAAAILVIHAVALPVYSYWAGRHYLAFSLFTPNRLRVSA